MTQQFNTTTSMGRLTLNVLLSFAQFEREIIGERTRDKMSAARRKGKWTGGRPMLGYDLDPAGGRLRVNEAEAKSVRAIFDTYLKTESLNETVREVNRRGIRTKRWTTRRGRERGGNAWDKGRIQHLLPKRHLRGQVEHRGTLYPGEHPAIVEPEVWERVQRLLKRNGRSGGRAVRNKHGALLQGLLWCAACDCADGAHLLPQGREAVPVLRLPPRPAERPSRLPGPVASGRGDRAVRGRADPDGGDGPCPAPGSSARRSGEAHQERLEDLARDRREAETSLRALAAEVKRVAGRGNGAAPGWRNSRRRSPAAESRLQTLRRQQEDAEPADEAEVTALLERFDPLWEALSPREQARAVQLLVERVTWDAPKETVTVTFRPGGFPALVKQEAA